MNPITLCVYIDPSVLFPPNCCTKLRGKVVTMLGDTLVPMPQYLGYMCSLFHMPAIHT